MKKFAGFYYQALDEIGFFQGPFGHFSRQLIGLNLVQCSLLTVAGMAQEDHAQHRHAVFAGWQLGIGAQLIGGFPETIFDFGNVL
ncbi:MAG: hypothetical protein Q8L79_14265 [Methylobacter sp.]|uniref:hypothetical protein n=1 Tax=Methylobacter sp. TaxID=2051955 RepID=UPI0027317FEF|nr:hypothetical protein [Methylobacter sp.]MDP1666273.1 hypothetical protein [Methylobacter sp.]